MSDKRNLTELIDEGDAVDYVARSGVAMVLTNPRLDDNPIVYVNRAFEDVTGYSQAAAVGRNCRFLQGEGTNQDDIDKLGRAIALEEEVAVDLLNYRANGVAFHNRLIVSPIRDPEGKVVYFLGIQKGMGDGTKDLAGDDADDQMQEIQHRVKNHLAMIVGLIRLQSRNAENPETFSSLARRVEGLQLLYEEMEVAAGTASQQIPAGTYLSRVANAVAHLDGRRGVRVNIQVEPISVNVDTATRLGLALSEILTNAFQHAFDGLDEGVVEVRLTALAAGGLRLQISDDGNGIPEGITWPDTNSLGGRIVSGLVDDLQGTLKITNGAAGTVVMIEVPAGGEDDG
ncbi:MAG: PAS domain-containing protein [Shimia sp.]